MKKISLLLLSVALCGTSFAQKKGGTKKKTTTTTETTAATNFEGTIAFRMETKKDTTANLYSVKGNVVRLDQMGKKTGKVEGSFVFDLTGKTIRFVQHSRKVWGQQKAEGTANIQGACKAEKTKNTKVLLDKYTCTEYVVTNETEKTKISYWIYSPDKSGMKFDFFTSVVNLWNRKDKVSVYFRQIKNLPAGSMAFASTEWLDGKQVGMLEMQKVDAKAMTDADVGIPSDYKEFKQ